MSRATPRSVTRFCRESLPLLLDAADGERMLQDAAAVVSTDRWNSFDRFHQTTGTLTRRFREAGVRVEVEPVQTSLRFSVS